MTGKVLIDGDIVAYRASFSAQDKEVEAAIQTTDELMQYIWDKTIDLPFPDTSDYHVYLTGRDNFRFDVAKSHPYKGNRKGKKPEHLQDVRLHLINKYPTTVSEGEEADDVIAMEATRLGPETIIASIDKDFKQVPCVHYNFNTDVWDSVEEWEGLKYFYEQILTGDAVDNIKGLYRVGPVKAYRILEGSSTEEDLWDACVKAYDGDVDRVLENARLLWLRRYEGQMWEPPKGDN